MTSKQPDANLDSASPQWQKLSETQKAFERARKKRRRRVSIAPSTRPENEDEITLEPESECATPEAEKEYVAPDAPLDIQPDEKPAEKQAADKRSEQKPSRGKSNGKSNGKPGGANQSEESNRVHGGAKKPSR